MAFELTGLDSYDDDALLAELRRAVAMLPPGPVTRKAFDEVSRVTSLTLVRRFGGWQDALRRAGCAERYSGRPVSQKMHSQRAKRLSEEELISELQRVAASLGVGTLTLEQFNAGSQVANAAVMQRRFGSWKAALERAGLRLSPLGRRYTADAYYENILTVWTHYGRQPLFNEMNVEPSIIPSSAYAARFGGWRKALSAFVERVNSDREMTQTPIPLTEVATVSAGPAPAARPPVRTIPVGLRYDVLRRDSFKCVICGASPATDPLCKLHVDHIVPFSRGGRTDEGNLRTLCSHCNLGKRDKVEAGSV